jgi:hypothetical protein
MDTNPPQASVPNQQPHQRVPGPFPLPPAPPAELKPIPRWIWITTAIVILLLAGLVIPAIRSFQKERAAASAVVANLHSSMIRGDDAGIFSLADPSYQQQFGEENSAKLFANVRAQLGAPRSSKLIRAYFSSKPAVGQIITMRFSTVFDKGPGIETIRLHKVNGQYLLLSYFVRSKLIPVTEAPNLNPIETAPPSQGPNR